MHAVAFDAGCETLANGPFGRVRRVGSPHRIAPLLDGVGRFQNHDDHGAFGHELHQRAVKWPLAMDGVKVLGFQLAQALHFHSGDAETGFLGDGDNVAGLIRGYGVGFDDCKSAFHILLKMFFDPFADFGGRSAHVDARRPSWRRSCPRLFRCRLR